jgi:predicted RNase H-like HicB family nuclease
VTLADYLRIPYVLEAFSLETADGEWTNRLSYPELGDCVVEAKAIEEAIDKLEQRRVTHIVQLLRAGILPPESRPPMLDIELRGLLERLGLLGDIEQMLDLDAKQIREISHAG